MQLKSYPKKSSVQGELLATLDGATKVVDRLLEAVGRRPEKNGRRPGESSKRSSTKTLAKKVGYLKDSSENHGAEL